MATAKVVYTGELRTTCTHLLSGTSIVTDAPIDNNGKGEAFSPTDLVATALTACMASIVGIYCNNHGYNYTHCESEVTKVMESNPRRISELHVKMDFSGNNWDAEIQKRIIAVAEACPVAKSIHPDIKVTFEYLF